MEQHGADYLIGVKGNCSKTLETMRGPDWRGAQRTSRKWRKSPGREERRKLEVIRLKPGTIAFCDARRAVRVTRRPRERERR